MNTFILRALLFWYAINDSLLIAVTTLVGSNELAAKTSGVPFLPSEFAIACSVFIAFAVAFNKHLVTWIAALRDIIAKAAIVPLALLLMTGCMSVPKTVVSFDPVKHTLDIQSPKDIAITNISVLTLSATATNPATFLLTIGSYSSKNNIDVIKAIVERNSEMQRQLIEGGGAVLSEVVGAMK